MGIKKILVIGQTPPPYGGQAVMIEHLINAQYENTKIYHIRMAFSKGMKDMGKFQFFKIFHLFEIIFKIYYYRLFKGTKIIYYPPSGPNSAIYRDMAILFPTRWLFQKTIFHFHASGLSQHLIKKNLIFRYIFQVCFNKPDIAIRLSESCPNEGQQINAKQCFIVPNGLPDCAIIPNKIIHKKYINIAFIGLLEQSKGELDIIRAAYILKNKGYFIQVKIAGEFKSIEYRNLFFNTISKYGLLNEVKYVGIIKGNDKKVFFKNSDIFCFPSYFHSESFPLVLIEAMSYGLPIIASKWRGIVDMVKDGYNGYLVNIKSPEEIVDKITLLYNDIELRRKICKNSRYEFEQKYSLKEHIKLMNNIFNKI